MHRAPNLAQPTRTGARAHGCVAGRCGRIVAVALGCVVGLHGRISGAPAPYRGRVRSQVRPYRGLPRDTMPSRLAPLVTIHLIVLRYNPQLPAPAGHNTIHFIAIQYPLLQRLLVTIQSVYCDPIPLPRLPYCNTMPAHCNTIFFSNQPALSCNTLPLLQYNSLPTRLGHNTIFFSFLQYNPSNYTPRVAIQFFYHNTIGQ